MRRRFDSRMWTFRQLEKFSLSISTFDDRRCPADAHGMSRRLVVRKYRRYGTKRRRSFLHVDGMYTCHWYVIDTSSIRHFTRHIHWWRFIKSRLLYILIIILLIIYRLYIYKFRNVYEKYVLKINNIYLFIY